MFQVSISFWSDLNFNTLPHAALSLCQIKDIKALEKVQRKASRLALKHKWGEMNHAECCRLLKWQTLEKCRKFLSLVQYYKIVFGLSRLPF